MIVGGVPMLFGGADLSGSDPSFANVSLLLHGDGTDLSTTFTDSSLTPKTPTVFGNAKISTAQSKFGGASMLFDGTGDYLSYASNAAYNFGTADYTMEMWVRPATVGSVQGILSRYTLWDTTVGFYLDISAARVVRYYAGNNVPIILNSTTLVNANTWYHIAVTCASGVTRLFINGVQEASSGVSASISSNSAMGVAYELVAGSAYFNGHIEELRITKGKARYTANFTPDIVPFADRYSALLLHGDGANNSTTFTDSGPTVKTINRVGGPIISNAESKFGGTSIFFPGSAGHLLATTASDWKFLHDGTKWTIELWIKALNFSTNHVFASTAATTGVSGTLVTLLTSRLINVQIYRGVLTSYVINGSFATAFPNDTYWHHVELSLDMSLASDNCKCFVDGVSIGSLSKTANPVSASNPAFPLHIGAYAYSPVGDNTSTMYIDDYVITKNAVKHTTNFTPPTAAQLDY